MPCLKEVYLRRMRKAPCFRKWRSGVPGVLHALFVINMLCDNSALKMELAASGHAAKLTTCMRVMFVRGSCGSLYVFRAFLRKEHLRGSSARTHAFDCCDM